MKQYEKYVDVDGLRTRYFDVGSGDHTIVLLHGSNFGADLSADCAINWSRNFVDLGRFGRVIALDRLGQGYTDNPRTFDDYTMASVVKHVAGFVRRLGLPPVHLVGHSRGGYVSCRTTLDYPELVRTCTIVDSLTLAPGVGRMDSIMADPPHPPLSQEGQRWVMERYSHTYDHIDEEWLDGLVEVAHTEKYQCAISAMQNAPFIANLAKEKPETLQMLRSKGIGRPTLVIWSQNDPTAPIQLGFDLFKMISDAEARTQMHIFNRSGHFVYREHPREFNAVLGTWVLDN